MESGSSIHNVMAFNVAFNLNKVVNRHNFCKYFWAWSDKRWRDVALHKDTVLRAAFGRDPGQEENRQCDVSTFLKIKYGRNKSMTVLQHSSDMYKMNASSILGLERMLGLHTHLVTDWHRPHIHSSTLPANKLKLVHLINVNISASEWVTHVSHGNLIQLHMLYLKKIPKYLKLKQIIT